MDLNYSLSTLEKNKYVSIFFARLWCKRNALLSGIYVLKLQS